MDIVTCYQDIWACLQDENSRGALTAVGTFLAVVIGGIWVFLTYFADQSKKPDLTSTSNSQALTTGQNSTPQQNLTQSNNAPVHVTQYIGYTIEQHQQALKEREAQIRADLSRAHSAEKLILERELNATHEALTHVEKDYQEKIEQLQKQIDALDNIKAIVPHDAFNKAQKALLNGDTKLADDLYASLQDKATEVAAEAAYQRGVIAEHEIRWQEALKHFLRANELLADNEKYLNNLAILYRLNGQYLPATDIFKKLYEVSLIKYGSESLEFASYNNNLADLYILQCKYDEAEPLFKKAIAIFENALGFEHPSLATCYNNLADLYRVQGKYDEAETLFKKVIEIDKKALGFEHPSLATCYNNLADLYRVQGKYDEAETLFKKVIEIDKKALGFEHPDLATDFNNLAGLYRSQGKSDAAEPLYKKAIAIDEKALGFEHPNLATDYNNLAFLYSAKGKYDEAEPLYKLAIAIVEKTLGMNHPKTQTVVENYISCLEAQGKLTLELRKKFGLE